MTTLKQAEIMHCQKCNLQLFSSVSLFAFFKPPLQEEIRQLALPVLAPRDTFISLILNARGKAACGEFRGLLVLRFVAHFVCINVQKWINYVYHLYEQR